MEQMIDLVGVLATDQEIINVTGVSNRNSVFIPASGVLHYHIKKLSDDNIETYSADEDFFLGYLSCIKEYAEYEKFSLAEENRIQSFYEFIDQFVVIFHYMRPGGIFAPFCKISDISLIKKPKQFQRNSRYHAVPFFESYMNITDWERARRDYVAREYFQVAEFLKRIIEQRPIGHIRGIGDIEDLPNFVLWKDETTILAIGPFSEKEYTDAGYVLRGANLQVYPLKEEWIDQILKVHTNPTIAHLPTTMIRAISETLKSGQGIAVKDFLDQLANDSSVQAYVSSADWKASVPKTEQRILESLEYHCQEQNMRFQEQDRINFHISMKMDSLVILSGMSGIGKSSLAQLYAEAIGAKFLNVAVSPSWNDDSDLLGYYDSMNHVYCPAENQFVSTLVEAMKNPETMYMICLDEMNLARVEHYFAQFLSLLEKKERILKLYDESLEAVTSNAEQYPTKVRIGNNIRFLGTVNIDETTYHFSDKVLDRSNIINLHIENYALPYEKKYYVEWVDSVWTSTEYNSYVKSAGTPNDILRSCLWELHELFIENGLNSGVGPRVVVKIEEYLANIPSDLEKNGMKLGEAIDIQVAQRILTKVRGREEQLREILADGIEENKCLHSIFDRYAMLSDFTECRKIVNKKRKELVIYGYCI